MFNRPLSYWSAGYYKNHNKHPPSTRPLSPSRLFLLLLHLVVVHSKTEPIHPNDDNNNNTTTTVKKCRQQCSSKKSERASARGTNSSLCCRKIESSAHNSLLGMHPPRENELLASREKILVNYNEQRDKSLTLSFKPINELKNRTMNTVCEQIVNKFTFDLPSAELGVSLPLSNKVSSFCIFTSNHRKRDGIAFSEPVSE